MESLSVSAFGAALIATGTGAFFYGAYAFGSRVAMRQMASNGGAGVTVATFERFPNRFGRVATAATVAVAFPGYIGGLVWNRVRGFQQRCGE